MKRPLDLPNTNTTPTAAYPYGQLRDDIVAGDGTGTPVRADWQQDLMYMPLILAERADIIPNGVAESVTTNQINAVMDKHPFTNPVAATSVVGTDKIAVGTGGSSNTPKLATLDTITKYVTGRRNYFVNGCLRLWQAAPSTVLNPATGLTYAVPNFPYNADQWRTLINGTDGTCNVSRQVFTVGQTDVPDEPRYFIRHITAAATGVTTRCVLVQYLEGVRTLAGQQVTVSFWARANSGTPKIGIATYQDFANVSGGSADVALNQGTVTLSTTWTKHSLTFTVPSIAGKSIGTSGDDNLGIRLWLSAGSSNATEAGAIGIQNNTFDITMLQIEKGTVATDFEWLNMSEVVAQCQRFYEKSYNLETPPGTITTSGMGNFAGTSDSAGNLQVTVRFCTVKRKTPAFAGINCYNPYNGVLNGIRRATSAGGNVDVIGVDRVYMGESSALLYITHGAGGYIAGTIEYHWTADARY